MNVRLSEIKTFFTQNKVNGPIRLNDYTVVLDVQKMVDTHVTILEGEPGKRVKTTHRERIKNLYLKVQDMITMGDLVISDPGDEQEGVRVWQ